MRARMASRVARNAARRSAADPSDGGRVGKVPVLDLRGPGEDRTGLGGAVTDADHVVPGLSHELIEVPGARLRDVDAEFGRTSAVEGMEPGRIGGRGRDLESSAAEYAQLRLSEL